MMHVAISKVLICCLVATITQAKHLNEQKKSYENFKVLRVEIPDEKSLKYISHPGLNSLYNIWDEPRIGGHADIMVSPQNMDVVISGLKEVGLEFTTWIENVQELINLEDQPTKTSINVNAGHPMTWDEYHSQDDMEAYMDYLVATYPDMVSIESIGSSYEGREMRVLKICKSGTCGEKSTMWIDSGIHAREWISPATGTFLMKELVENSANYPAELLDKLDWFILPVFNPDGYEYTRTNDRMWRKNRTPGNVCHGTDLNRNFGYHWNDGGSSDNECSDTYHGKSAFSEPETQVVRDYIMKNKDHIKYYQNLHSYSQLVLLPWGYTYQHPDNYQEMLAFGTEGNKALLATHGSVYEVGSIPGLLYIASGSAADWALGDAGVPYSYSIELRDTGHYGFLLPPEQIIPTGEEIMAFHVSAGQQIIAEFGQ